MDTFTVETMTEPVPDADLAGLIDSLVGLWRDDGSHHDTSINQDWPHRSGVDYFRDLFGDANGLVLAARAVGPASGDIVGHLVGRFLPANDFRVMPSAILESMQVRSDLRGCGIGGRLVDAFLSWAEQRGSGRVTVTANAGNTAAQAFYRSHGFVPASMTFQRTATTTPGEAVLSAIT